MSKPPSRLIRQNQVRQNENLGALTPQLLFAAALRHHNAGDLGVAERLYRQVLAIQPLHAVAHNNLGNTLQGLGKASDAVGHFEKAIALKPGYAEAHNNLANTLHAIGSLEESWRHFKTALCLTPTYPQAHNNLGNLLLTLGQLEDAAASYKLALDFSPSYPEAHSNLGHALTGLNQLDEAKSHCDQALALHPKYAAAYNNLGVIQHRQAQFEEAQASYRAAIQLRPNYPEAYLNLGNLLESQGLFSDALALYEKALSLRHDYALAHLNRSLIQLKMGNFGDGWHGHEWRWRQRGVREPRLNLRQPQWTGAPLNGASILLHAEQGLGDSIQFLRYVPMVRAAGGRILLEIPATLRRLVSKLVCADELILSGTPRPPTDFHCPLMSLPLSFKTGEHTIPNGESYLSVPHEAQQKAAGLLSKFQKPRIGLVWAGNPKHLKDRFRSIPLSIFAKITDCEEASFFSLQIGESATELPKSSFPIVSLSAEIEDLADTAALIQQLDLVISVDTSVAHLAGALGIATWLLLSTDSDWRWLIDREDSPWYASIRIFRQSAFGNWESVIETVKSSLERFVSEACNQSSSPKQ